MRDRLRHRGPDDEGLHVEPGIGLAHSRLSIIDVSGGHQPCYSEDRSIVAVFNGEIYNYRELTDELAALGHVFRSDGDAEVLVHGWEEWGEESVSRYRGMFAFALWDRRRKTAFLARDRFGIKPLYYAELDSGELVFASEIKSLLAHPGVSRQLDPEAIEDFFAFGYVPQPRSIYRQVKKLAAGHTLSIHPGGRAAPRCYWDLRFEVAGNASDGERAHELGQRLRGAVAAHLVSEVPIGAFLSGGVDSGGVVAMMASQSTEAVHTCSIAFAERSRDESAFAARVPERYATDHHVETVHTADANVIDLIVDLYDEPFADSSAVPTHRLCGLARNWMKVALSGDGADEVFAGYGRYRAHVNEERVRSLLPAAIRAPLFGALGRVYPKADWAPRVVRAKTTFESLAVDSIEGYFHCVSMLGDRLRDALFRDGFQRRLAGYRAVEVFRSHAENAPEHPLSRAQYLDMKTYLEGDILTKVDRASMAHSLEVRVPMLDHELVEWAASLPPRARMHRGQGKLVLKRALVPYLDAATLSRPKMGFEVPLTTWLRGPLREQVHRLLASPALLDSGFFEERFLRRMVSENESGRRDFSAPLWSLLVFEAFLRRL